MSKVFSSTSRKTAFFVFAFSFVVAVVASAQAPVPLVCSGEALQVGGTPTTSQLFTIDQSMTPFNFTEVGEENDFPINAIGFSRNTGLIWGWAKDQSELVIIDADGAVFFQGNTTPALPAGESLIAGDISVNPGGDEILFLARSNLGVLYKVNLTDLTMTSISSTLPNAEDRVPDFAFNPKDGLLYGGSVRLDNEVERIIQINPTTGATAAQAVTNGPGVDISDAQGFGAAWFNIAGDFFIYDNGRDAGTGAIYEIDLGDPPFSRAEAVVAQLGTQEVTDNDGAACLAGEIGAAKEMTLLSTNPSRIAVDFYFKNFSDTETLTALAAADGLSDTFGVHGTDWQFISIDEVPSGTFDNANFDGHTDLDLINNAQSLGPNETAQIRVVVELLTIAGADDNGEFCNQVTVTAELGGVTIGDLSTSGSNCDPDGDGFPSEDDVTCRAAISFPVELQAFSID